MNNIPLFFILYLTVGFIEVLGSPGPLAKPENDVHFHINMKSNDNTDAAGEMQIKSKETGQDYSEDGEEALQACSGRCGIGYNKMLPCQCNSKCSKYKNCCKDYESAGCLSCRGRCN